MHSRYMAFALCLLAGIVQSGQTQNIAQPQQSKEGDVSHGGPLKISMIYRRLFHKIESLDGLADHEELNGKVVASLRGSIQRDLQLNDTEAGELRAIARACLVEVRALDARAKVIIETARAASAGRMPKCPNILFALQNQRESLFLNARSQIKQVFGNYRFQSFEEQALSCMSKTAAQPPSGHILQSAAKRLGK